MAAPLRSLDNLRYYSVPDDEVDQMPQADLELTIDQAEQDLQRLDTDALDYTASLKTLIKLLIKKFRLTLAPEDLQTAIFRAEEMVVSTPPDHAERAIRVEGWIDLMHFKVRLTGSHEEAFQELIHTVNQAGSRIEDISSASGNTGLVKLPT